MTRKKKRGMTYIPYDYEEAFNQQIETLHEYFIEQMLKFRFKAVYACKEVRAGEQLEIEIYPEFSKISEIPEEARLKKDNSKAQKSLNDKNARKYVNRLIEHNFTDRDIWITLTYGKGQEPADMDEAIKNMQNYIRRINYQRKKRGLPNAKYVYVTEFSPGSKIRWHHHLVMDGLLDMDLVEKTWKKGQRNETRRLEKDEYGLTGLANYITKEPRGKKRWNSSTNLKQFRVRKIHSKKDQSGKYKKMESYVKEMVKDRSYLEWQMKKWFPEYLFTESQVYYNDFNGMFYIRARMRKRREIP